MKNGYLGELTRPEIRREQNRLFRECERANARVTALYKVTFTGYGRDDEYEDAKLALSVAQQAYQRFVADYLITP